MKLSDFFPPEAQWDPLSFPGDSWGVMVSIDPSSVPSRSPSLVLFMTVVRVRDASGRPPACGPRWRVLLAVGGTSLFPCDIATIDVGEGVLPWDNALRVVADILQRHGLTVGNHPKTGLEADGCVG